MPGDHADYASWSWLYCLPAQRRPAVASWTKPRQSWLDRPEDGDHGAARGRTARSDGPAHFLRRGPFPPFPFQVGGVGVRPRRSSGRFAGSTHRRFAVPRWWSGGDSNRRSLFQYRCECARRMCGLTVRPAHATKGALCMANCSVVACAMRQLSSTSVAQRKDCIARNHRAAP